MSTLSVDIGAKIAGELSEGIDAKQRVIGGLIPTVTRITGLLIGALRAGRKVLLFGNGGSAADSQHIAAELVSRFRRGRKALPAIALTTDTSILTSIGNDYGFQELFSRQIEALGEKGDVAIAISTSGNSINVLNGVRTAKQAGLLTVGFTGEDGGKLKDAVDICFCAPTQSTPRIQEVHIAVAHAICEAIDESFYVPTA